MQSYKDQVYINKTKFAIDKNLFDSLVELITKSNLLMNILNKDNIDKYANDMKEISQLSHAQAKEYKKANKVTIQQPYVDKIKYIEMQLNKDNSILEKMKIIVVKLDTIFILIPYTISKIEIRMRSILINNKNVMDGISHFMNFYLLNQQY